MSMLNCKEASRLVSQAMDRPLGWRESIALRVHLFYCSGCTNFRRQVDVLHKMSLHLSGRDQPPAP